MQCPFRDFQVKRMFRGIGLCTSNCLLYYELASHQVTRDATWIVYRVRKGYLRTTYVSIVHLDPDILIFHLDQSCSLELSVLNRFAVKSAHLWTVARLLAAYSVAIFSSLSNAPSERNLAQQKRLKFSVFNNKNFYLSVVDSIFF